MDRGFFLLCLSLTQISTILGQTLTGEILKQEAFCDVNNVILSCDSDSIIALGNVLLGYNTTRCGTQCCSFSIHDCIINFRDIETVKRKCSGESTCSPLLLSNGNFCNFGMQPASYLYFEYFCIPKSRVTSICSGTTVDSPTGEPLYLTNEGFPSVTADANSCSCSFEAKSCSSNTASFIIDADLYLDTTTCNQTILFTDSNNLSLGSVACKSYYDNYITQQTFKTNYIKIDFINNSTQNREGIFIIGFKAEENVSFALSCPGKPPTTCSDSTTSATTKLTTITLTTTTPTTPTTSSITTTTPTATLTTITQPTTTSTTTTHPTTTIPTNTSATTTTPTSTLATTPTTTSTTKTQPITTLTTIPTTTSTTTTQPTTTLTTTTTQPTTTSTTTTTQPTTTSTTTTLTTTSTTTTQPTATSTMTTSPTSTLTTTAPPTTTLATTTPPTTTSTTTTAPTTTSTTTTPPTTTSASTTPPTTTSTTTTPPTTASTTTTQPTSTSTNTTSPTSTIGTPTTTSTKTTENADKDKPDRPMSVIVTVPIVFVLACFGIAIAIAKKVFSLFILNYHN